MAHFSLQETSAIEQNPLRHTIGIVREALRDAESDVPVEDGPDADKFDEPGRPRLFVAAIGKLLSILSASDVSLTLDSRTGREALVSDLTAIRLRVLKGDIDHKLFRPLSQLVIHQAPDLEIWAAVIAVILSVTQSTPPPSLPPSFDTPITHSSASQQGSEQTRKKIEPRVFEEIRQCTHRAVEGFHEKYFEGRPWSRRANLIYKESQEHYDKDQGKWKELPIGATEDDVCNWWLGLQLELLRRERASYFRSSGKARVGGEAKRQLDLFVKAKVAKVATVDEKHDWKDVLVVGELKKADQKNKSLWLQVGSAVRNVFAHQPTRRFVHAFTLTGTEMETWVFDRSGPYSGDTFDIHREPERFIQVFCSYLMMNDEELGLDTFTKRKDDKLFATIPTESRGKTRKRKFEMEPAPIAFQRAIVCRGTACFSAKIAGAEKFDAVMKFSWTSSLRKAEADLLNKAKERGVKGIAKVVGYQEEITSIEALRAGLTFSTPHKFRPVPNSNHTSFSQSLPPASQSFSQFHGLSLVSGASRKRRSVDSSSPASKRSRSGSQLAAECKREDAELTYAVHEAQGTSLVGNEQLPFENRILRALAISPAGKPISNFSSVPELIGGLRDAIKVHRSLLLDGKILHRDISENNIIITDPEDADGFRGMLIDLDLAKEDGKGPSGARHRTGTMEFMAIEVLLGISHTYRHDLEAFYYVLLWLCVRRGWSLSRSPKRQPRGNPLSHWYTGTYEDIARNKRGDMDKNGLEDVLLLFPPMLGCVKALCRTIRDVLFPYKQGLFTGTPCDSELLYGPIINAFDDSLKEIQEMEETTEEN